MNTETQVLTLAQWLSPSFPVGAFAYSHGLETAMQTGVISCAKTLEDWLSDVLLHGSGFSDAVLLCAAYQCSNAAQLKEINAAALAFAASSERVMETTLQGSAFCQTTSAILNAEQGALCYPVALGARAATQGIEVQICAAMYLQAFISNLVSAAVRAVPLGQTEGQRVLMRLTSLCESTAKKAQSATLEDLQSSAFLSDIAAMQHETLQPRIFRS